MLFKRIDEFLEKLFLRNKKEVVKKEPVAKQTDKELLIAVKYAELENNVVYWVVTTTGVYQCKGVRFLTGNASETTIQSLHKGFVFRTEAEATKMYDRLMGCRYA